MQRTLRALLAVGALTLVSATTTRAQTAQIVTDLVNDVSQVEQKLVGLAKAIPAAKYDWRPGAGVRSIGEVFLHVASDNYLIPAVIGIPADPATGIKGEDYKTALAFEKRQLSQDEIVAELEKSFAHLKRVMNETTPEKVESKVSLFGQSFTMQQTWILATTHLHEHLGQAIAYARSNGVVPPWSQ
jgi:uncharacterized damage-inducible protein DinB